MAEEDAADRLVARAIESVLEQVPGAPDTSTPESSSSKMQPWAETAGPPSTRSKRPLEELLGELAARVEGNPGALAALVTRGRHPTLAFFDRFSGRPAAPGGSSQEAHEPGSSSGRRRRRRRGAPAVPGTVPSGPSPPLSTDPGAPGRGRRRSRRGRGRGGASTPDGPAAVGGDRPAAPRPAGQQQRPPSDGGGSAPGGGGGGRRRRGRRGRGGGGQPPPG